VASERPSLFADAVRQTQEGGNTFNALFDTERNRIEKIILGEEGNLPITVSPATRCLDYLKMLLPPRAIRYANDETGLEDFLLSTTEDAIITEILRRDRETEYGRLIHPTRNVGPCHFDEVYTAYESAVVGFAFNRGVRDPDRLGNITGNVFMRLRARFDPLLGSFVGLLFQTTRLECLHGRQGTTIPIAPNISVDREFAALGSVTLAVHDDRLRMIANLDRPAHQLICFLFDHDLGWKPQRIAETFSNESLRNMFDECVEEYADWLESDHEHVLRCLHRLKERICSAADEHLGAYFSEPREPGQKVSDWSYQTGKALATAIESEEQDYLRIVFGGDVKPKDDPRELLAFAMMRLLNSRTDATDSYMTLPLFDLLHKEFEPRYLNKSTRLTPGQLRECLHSLSEEVALRRGGGLRGDHSNQDSTEWHRRVRARIQSDLIRPSLDERCRGLLFAFVNRYL
jgi:hypothetical protein